MSTVEPIMKRFAPSQTKKQQAKNTQKQRKNTASGDELCSSILLKVRLKTCTQEDTTAKAADQAPYKKGINRAMIQQLTPKTVQSFSHHAHPQEHYPN